MTSGDLKTKPSSQSAHLLRGFLFIVVAVTFWGGSASLAKYLITARFDTLIVTQTRSSLSFVLLVLYLAATNRSVFRIRVVDLPKFLSIGVIGVAVTNFAYYFTVKESTVATAILIQNTAPVWVTIYAVTISREEVFSRAKVTSLVIALLGCYLAVSGGSAGAIKLKGWAILSGPASAFTYAYMLLGGKSLLRTYSAWTMLVYALGFATLFWLLINPPWQIAAKAYTPGDWGILWLFAIVSILIPYTMFTSSLKLLEASTVGIATTLEPVVAIVIAYFALGETLSAIQIVGGIAVVAAVVLLQVRPERFLRLKGAPERAE